MATLHNISIVLVAAESIAPQSIRPETLAEAGIVAKTWSLGEQQISTPVFAVTQYTNGISIRTEGGTRCVFQQDIGGDLRDEYLVPEVARRYIDATRLIPYSAVGNNWVLRIPISDSVQWFREQMGQFRNLRDFSPDIIRLVRELPALGATFNLTLKAEAPQSVTVDCNFHFQVDSSSSARAALDQWMQCQELLRSDALDMLES